MELQLSTNMAARLLETIGPAIVRGDYSHQAFPNEAESIALFGVSRTVVREAVKSLMAKGLLESRPRIGTRVLPPAHWNLLDPDVLRWIVASPVPAAFLKDYENVRKATASMAAGLAANLAESAALKNIEDTYWSLHSARNSDDQATAIERFHEAIFNASENNVLRRLRMNMSAVFAKLTRELVTFNRIDLHHYSDVIDAIRSRDALRAETAMRRLLDREGQNIATASDKASSWQASQNAKAK